MTPNFKLEEFLQSQTAKNLGIDNTPRPEHLKNLVLLSVGMEQIRSYLEHRPILIRSGYRSPALNAAVKGVKNSDHALGYAADFTVNGLSAPEVAKRIDKSPLVYDQLILETSRGIVHVSFNPRLRRQTLTQKGGPGTPVENGIKV
jgi:hypothetical protein